MASYVVLARKWRPSQFSDIGGQGPVVRTLMNAIQSDRIHHAYLLTGSRGIGKTSIARIFAKTIRCPNVKWDGTWLRACDECSSCREIAAGNSVDVIEIDGASNNGVDAVREIRENAKFLPSSGTRKIYIIDEVHMLTTAAFNALLKTLEEPPAHVLFILATTEPQKIPGTILSRCQRFDLKRFTVAQVQTRLEEVALAEGIQIEAGAVALLSRAADGSMRDALSLFDQVIAFAGMKISAGAVRESIGLIESQSLLGILRGIFSRDAKSAIAIVNDVYRAGHDLKLLSKNLLEYLHAAILLKVGIDSAAAELPAEEALELREIAKLREIEEIELFFQAFQNGTEWISRSPQPKLVLEVLVVKCATADALVMLPPRGGNPKSGSQQGAEQTNASVQKPLTRSVSETPAHTASTSPVGNPPKPSIVPMVKDLSTGMTPPATVPKPTESAQTGLPKASLLFTGSSPMAMKKPNSLGHSSDETRAVHAVPAGPKTFEGFISHVRKYRPAMASALENGICDPFPSEPEIDFVVTFSPQNASVYHGLLTSSAAVSELQKFTLEYLGMIKRVVVEVKDTGMLSVAERRENDLSQREQNAKNAVTSHPLIAEARALFGGELGPIELIQPQDENETSRKGSHA
ncbi:MAG: DNA polymerase III subunit gamma/tau [Cryobacterium sp.]|nr:DNA polymerase III subunit gamma/tau [Oligoflexia bacterium]